MVFVQMFKYLYCGLESGNGVCNFFVGDIECGIMDWFEYGREMVFRINICGWCYVQIICQCVSQIGKDIGVQIGGNDGIQGLGM